MSHPADTTRGPVGTHVGPARDWFVQTRAGHVEGPLPETELRARAATGRLDPADRVSPDRAQWTPAASVPWLAFPTPGAVPARPLVDTVVAGPPVPAAGAAPSAAFLALDSIPGYELNGLLGTGACGVVFRAVQTRLDRVVALKTVRVAETAPRDVVARFEQEAVALARLQHPNIVTVYDCGHVQGRAFFAMELLDGEDLAQRLHRDGPLAERVAWLLARQTAAALDHADRHGVIHRDVKPANIFLVPPPTGFPLPAGVPMVKVTDFGLALTLREPGAADPAHTAAGVFLGTPVYMPPEQFNGPVDRRADIYSLGATVYHALTGRLPFDGRTVPEVVRQKGLPAPRLAAPVSEETADLVAAMMAAEPNERPGNYDELIARIDALPCLDGAFTSAGLPIGTGAHAVPTHPRAELSADGAARPQARASAAAGSEPSPLARKRKRWGYAIAAALVVGLGLGAAALAGAFNRSVLPPPPSPKPTAYATRTQAGLFDGRSVLPWAGRNIDLGTDGENKPVLSGWGLIARRLDAPKQFRVTLALDPHEAPNVEVVLATGGGSPDTTPQWLVKLDRAAGTATFGKRAGSNGAFEPLGAAVPVPTLTARTAEGLPPYLELQYERAGGELSARFNYKPLGSAPDAGMRTTEVRLITDGPIKLESALLEELVPVE